MSYSNYLGRNQADPTQPSVNPYAQQDDSPGFLDYLTDVPMGILRGGVSFGESLFEGADGIAEMLGGDIFEGNDLTWSEDLLGENRTWVGGLTQGITQFSLGFIPATKALGAIGKLDKLRKSGLAGRIAFDSLAGVPADLLAFNGHEGRLSDLIQQYPALQNPISEALASDPDDSEWEGRFKNAAEGILIGPVADLFLSSLRFFKGAKQAEAEGGPKARTDWIQKNQTKFEKELEKIEDPLTLQEANNQLRKLKVGDEEIEAFNTLVSANASAYGVKADTLVGLTMSRFERGVEVSPDALQQSVALRIGDEELELGGKANLSRIQEKLHERSLGILGRKLDPANDADLNKVVDQLVEETEFQIKDSGLDSGEKWYGQEMEQAFDSLVRIEPRLKDNLPYQGLFKAVLAITSNGNKVGANSEYALRAFRGWLDTGGKKFQDKTLNGKGYGRRGRIITQGLRGLEELIDKWGAEKTAKWLSEEHTVKELKEVRTSLSVYKSEGVSGKADEMKRGSLIFGPKVGEFFQNVDGNTVRGTFDVWWTRTYRRLTGRLDEGSDAPRSSLDREQMQEVAERAAERMGLEVADLQAVAWYYEQGLYRDLGSTNVSESFSHAYRRIEGEELFTPGTPRNEAKAAEVDALRQDARSSQLRAGSVGRRSRTSRPSSRVNRLNQPDIDGSLDEARGEVEFDPTDGRAVIRLFENSDVSTVIHELGHTFRRNLDMFDPELSRKANEAFEIGEEGWTREKEEQFTDAFETYLREGKAPNPAVAKAFGKFKEWLTKIYKSVANSRLSDRVDPDVRELFDEMLGGRTAKQRNLEIPVKVREAISSRMAAVTRGEMELDEAVEGIDLNFDKLAADVEAKHLINIVSEELGEQIGKLKGGVESLETTKLRSLKVLEEDLDADGSLLDRLSSRQADAKDVVAAKMVLSGLASKIMSMSREMDMGNLTKRKIVQLQRHVIEMAHLQADLKANITNAARITSAGRIPLENTVTADKLDEIIIRSGGDKQMRDIIQHLKMTQGNTREVVKVINSRWDKGLRKWINVHHAVWMNGLLSGPVTHAVNLMSTFLHGGVRSIEKSVGGALTLNQQAAREGVDELQGLFWSLKDAGKMFFKVLWSGDSVLDVDHRTIDIDTNSSITRKESSAPLGQKSPMGLAIDFIAGTVKLPSRFLGAEDELNKQLFYRSHMFAKGLQDARKQGLPAGERNKHAREFVKNSIDENGQALDVDGLYYAQEGTFTNDLGYGFGQTLQKAVNNHPIARLALPFVRTPTNIFRQLWRHTPGLGMWQKQWAADYHSGDPAKRALAVGQQVVGMTLAGGAFMAAASGRITGGGPSEPGERALLRQTGWQPYSIVFTDEETGKKEYVSYQRIDPFASALGLVADYVEMGNRIEDQEQEEIAVGIMAAFAKNITNKTYLRGLSETVDVLTDPDRNVKKWLQRQAGSYVPNVLNQTNPDDTMREVRTYIDAVKSRTPGYSPTLDPKRNVFGQPITYQGAFGPSWVSPFYMSRGLDGAARQELTDLGISIGQPRENLEGIDLTKIRVKPTQTAYDRWLELSGQVKMNDKSIEDYLNELVQSEHYQKLPAQSTLPTGVDSARVKLVRRAIDRYRNKALMQMFQENPDIKQLYQNAVVNNRRISVLGAAAGEQQ